MLAISQLNIYSLFILFFSVFCVSLSTNGKEAELVYQQTNIEISKGKITETHFYEIRVNRRDGDRYAEVSIEYQKKNKVYDIEAAIFDKNGNEIRKLHKNDIIEKSASSDVGFYTDSYVKEFSMRYNQYPYTLKYSYKSQSDQFLSIEDWVPVLDWGIPTTKARLYVTIPYNYKLSYRVNNIDNCKIDSTESQKFYVWEASYHDDYKKESFSPSLSEFMPEVVVVPEHFYYEEEGYNRNWIDIGNWDQQLLKGLNDLPDSEKNRIREKTRNIKDTIDQIRNLFHYLQDETRYVCVTIKTGGHKPYPASYVALNKYGDCKALANYFMACLQEINVDAYYSLIHADDIINNPHIDFPSQQFNHIILYVPLTTDTLWLDCTSDLAFGYLGTFTQNRFSLVTKPDDSKFYRTPSLTMNDVLEKRKITANLAPDDILKTEFNCTYRGNKYETLFYLNSNFKPSEKQDYLNKYYVNSGFDIDTFSLNLPNRDSAFINFNYKATSGGQVKKYGNESLLKITELEIPRLELPEVRKLPLQINYPVNLVDTLVYNVSGNYKILSLPKDLIVQSKFGEYKTGFRIENEKVCAYKSFKIYAGSYPLEEYNKFYSFITQVREAENSTYITLTSN